MPVWGRDAWSVAEWEMAGQGKLPRSWSVGVDGECRALLRAAGLTPAALAKRYLGTL